MHKAKEIDLVSFAIVITEGRGSWFVAAVICYLMVASTALPIIGFQHAIAQGCEIELTAPTLKSDSTVLAWVTEGQQYFITTVLSNCLHVDIPLVVLIEARNSEGVTEYLVSQPATLMADNQVEVGASWTPEHAGDYQLRTFVIDSFDEPQVLTPVMISEIMVQNESMNGETVVTLREGQREGPLLVQRIYADRVEGLNFPEYPVAMDEGLPITLRIGEAASNGCTILLTLTKIQDGSATFLKTVDESRPCPICWYQLGLMPGLQ